MKKYVVRTDMEGASGIVSYEQAEPGSMEYAEGRRYFMSDLRALVYGLRDGGADEILLYDEHYYGRNIELDDLPACVHVFAGKPPYQKDWAGGLTRDCTGLILLGFHAKAGSSGCLLNHSYSLDICDIEINGRSVGEIGNEAAIAGELGVPLVMMTGDSAGVREAEMLVPGVAAVPVKESLSEFGALCRPVNETQKEIYAVARAVASQGSRTVPFCIPGPITMKIHRTGKEMVICRGDTVLECWAQYLKEYA